MVNIEVLKQDDLIKEFRYDHLPFSLHAVSQSFLVIAKHILLNLADGPEKTASLKKLLEAKKSAIGERISSGY